MQKKTVAEKARNMVGDGKKPNRFFVSISNDYGAIQDGCVGWIGDILKDFKSYGGTIEMYEKYEDAKDSAIGYFNTSQRDESDLVFHVNRATVEDRISGTVYEISKVFNPATGEIWDDEQDDYERFSKLHT